VVRRDAKRGAVLRVLRRPSGSVATRKSLPERYPCRPPTHKQTASSTRYGNVVCRTTLPIRPQSFSLLPDTSHGQLASAERVVVHHRGHRGACPGSDCGLREEAMLAESSGRHRDLRAVVRMPASHGGEDHITSSLGFGASARGVNPTDWQADRDLVSGDTTLPPRWRSAHIVARLFGPHSRLA
jgi:hypothetical protein